MTMATHTSVYIEYSIIFVIGAPAKAAKHLLNAIQKIYFAAEIMKNTKLKMKWERPLRLPQQAAASVTSVA